VWLITLHGFGLDTGFIHCGDYNCTDYNYSERFNTGSFSGPTDGTVLRRRLTWRTDLFSLRRLTGDDSLTHWCRLTNPFRCQRLTNSLSCIAFPLQHRAVPMENTRPRLLGNHATRQYRVASVSMKPIVVLGMAQPYPGCDRCLWSNTSHYVHGSLCWQ
jgi:hypothetical protein